MRKRFIAKKERRDFSTIDKKPPTPFILLHRASFYIGGKNRDINISFRAGT